MTTLYRRYLNVVLKKRSKITCYSFTGTQLINYIREIFLICSLNNNEKTKRTAKVNSKNASTKLDVINNIEN